MEQSNNLLGNKRTTMEQPAGQQRDVSPVSEPAPKRVQQMDQILPNQVINKQPQSDQQQPSDPTAVSRKENQSLDQGSMFSNQTEQPGPKQSYARL